jgi:hypothetical protein
MAKGIRRVNKYVLHHRDKPGEAAHLLKTLKKHGINLLALTAFPAAAGTSQVELIPEDAAALETLARHYDWRLSKKRTGFLAQGKDRAGALVKLAERLGAAGINVTEIDAIAAGAERYGAVFWVRPKDIDRATLVLGSR